MASIAPFEPAPHIKPWLRRWENAHIALWLVKDMCWLLLVREVALIMAIPTVTLAGVITWLLRRNRVELVHNLAVCCWICGNVVWMIGEFYYDDTWRPYAKWFFFAGVAIMALYYGRLMLRRLRRKHAA